MAARFAVHGIIPALVTPFTSQGEVDDGALREIIQFELRHRVHGLFVCGSTGQGPVMPAEQRRAVGEIAVKEAKGKVPVIIQVGAINPQTSFDLAAHAESIGADAIASLTPFYYKPGEQAILEYFERLSKVTDLPIFVYNIPENTGNNVDASLLVRLAKIPNIVGIKDSSRDFTQLVDYLRTVPKGFNIYNGTESYLFSAYCAGAQAGVSAIANAVPELFVEMFEAFQRKDLERGAGLQLKIHAIRKIMNQPPIAPILATLKLRGLKSGLVKVPLRSMTPTETQTLRDSISEILPQIEPT